MALALDFTSNTKKTVVPQLREAHHLQALAEPPELGLSQSSFLGHVLRRGTTFVGSFAPC